MSFHVLAGLPRSGSTLLCNLLAQRDGVYVGSTSALPAALRGLSGLFTSSTEVSSDLISDPSARQRHLDVLRAVVDAWHPQAPIVIDKSRAWAQMSLLLRRVKPDAVIIVTVRDPREVFASIERQHQASAEYGHQAGILDRASAMLSPDGLIGSSCNAIEDLIRRRLPGVLFVGHPALAHDPHGTMRRVDAALGLDPFEYDFDTVSNASREVDELYRFKFPHEGSGSVGPPGGHWSDIIDADTAKQIIGRWPLYATTFGFATTL